MGIFLFISSKGKTFLNPGFLIKETNISLHIFCLKKTATLFNPSTVVCL